MTWLGKPHPATATFIALAAIAWIAVQPVVPWASGHFFPVTANNRITSIEDDAIPGWSIISGSADKLRDCRFVSIEWYLGDVNGSRAQIRFLEPTKTRTVGQFNWGNWSVQLDRKQILENSYAVTTHQCNSFYPTKTIFWDSSRDTST